MAAYRLAAESKEQVFSLRMHESWSFCEEWALVGLGRFHTGLASGTKSTINSMSLSRGIPDKSFKNILEYFWIIRISSNHGPSD